MWQKLILGGTLIALACGSAFAQEPKARPKNPQNPRPDGGGPREGDFGPRPVNPGAGPGQRGTGAGPQGERGKGPFNAPFGGRGPRGEGPDGPLRGGEPRGPGFVPGGGTRMGEYERLRREDPEMFALLNQDEVLEQQTLEMADKVRRATSDEREKLQTQLSELVNKHFDVRQQRRELQLKRMEAELSRLREAIKQRNDTRDSIIKERMTELVGEAKGLGF